MWQWIKQKLDGWKTMLAAAVSILIGIADVLNVIDLQALLSLFLPEGRVGSVAALLGLLFGLLRWVTTGEVGARRGNREEHAPS